jgi:hypothetical protein
MSSAVWQSSVFMAVGDWYALLTARINAAAPATAGVDIEVPAISVRQSIVLLVES